MLIRLLPEQVSSKWDLLAPMIQQAMPPHVGLSKVFMCNVLEAVLLEKAVVWVYMLDTEEIIACIVTAPYTDPITNNTIVLLYSLYTERPLTHEIWMDGLATLRKYANYVGNGGLWAFSNVPAIMRIAEHLGADTSHHFIDLN